MTCTLVWSEWDPSTDVHCSKRLVAVLCTALDLGYDVFAEAIPQESVLYLQVAISNDKATFKLTMSRTDRHYWRFVAWDGTIHDITIKYMERRYMRHLIEWLEDYA